MAQMTPRLNRQLLEAMIEGVNEILDLDLSVSFRNDGRVVIYNHETQNDISFANDDMAFGYLVGIRDAHKQTMQGA
ncbi:MAG: hypothetical protein KAH30_02155 [Caldisericia bacterium]|nr:hypothetical protein [Caldisericia bacterium]